MTAETSVDSIAGVKRTEAGSLVEGSRTDEYRTKTGTKWREGVLDRLRRLGTLELLVLLLVVPVAAEAHEPGYADAKIASPARTSRAGVRLAFPAGELPRRGMLVATGNVLSPLARWIVIDLDLMTIRQATTRLSDAEGPVKIQSERTDAISDDERRNMIASGNEVWIMPDPDPPMIGEPTDQLCSVALFDGDDVLQEVGSDCPRPRFLAVLEAPAAAANRRIDRIMAGAPRRTNRTGEGRTGIVPIDIGGCCGRRGHANARRQRRVGMECIGRGTGFQPVLGSN